MRACRSIARSARLPPVARVADRRRRPIDGPGRPRAPPRGRGSRSRASADARAGVGAGRSSGSARGADARRATPLGGRPSSAGRSMRSVATWRPSGRASRSPPRSTRGVPRPPARRIATRSPCAGPVRHRLRAPLAASSATAGPRPALGGAALQDDGRAARRRARRRRPDAGIVSTQAVEDVAGDAPADRREAVARADAHDRRRDDVGRRDRHAEVRRAEDDRRRGRLRREAWTGSSFTTRCPSS